MANTPVKGRVVRYVDITGEEWPAMIVQVNDTGGVALKVFRLDDVPLQERAIEQDEDAKKPGTWHWPPRT